MNIKLLLLPAALTDMEQAADWYGSKSASLRPVFLGDLEQTVDRILAFPSSSPVYRDGVRRALLKKFPYGIFYSLDANVVKILAVFNLLRDSKSLESRM